VERVRLLAGKEIAARGSQNTQNPPHSHALSSRNLLLLTNTNCRSRRTSLRPMVEACPPARKRPWRSRSEAAPPPKPPSDLVPADALRAFALPRALPCGATARCCAGPRAPPRDLAWALRGVRSALRDAYRGTTLPWSAAGKRCELRAAAQRLLFADPPGGGTPEPVAFVSFRVDEYEGGAAGELAAYVYEVYVAPESRRCGMAGALLALVDAVCRRVGVLRIVLTVFCSNTAALRLYKDKMGYVADLSCPTLHDNAEAGYQILTKTIAPEEEEETLKLSPPD
jgi:ribosomal protein S18 acetylase RimI-like enzyme